MAIIGTFTRTAKGFSGSLKTLTLTAKLQFVAETDKAKDSAPDYRVYLGTTEVGAAWKRTARDEVIAARVSQTTLSQNQTGTF